MKEFYLFLQLFHMYFKFCTTLGWFSVSKKVCKINRFTVKNNVLKLRNFPSFFTALSPVFSIFTDVK